MSRRRDKRPMLLEAGRWVGRTCIEVEVQASDGQRVRKEQQQLLEELTQAEKEDGFEAARTLLERRSSTVSAGALARAHLELAERAKRASSLEQVKYHMLQALKVQPRAAQE
ncbi:unnamed protein product [Cladocopium goreaui]|uniref:Uncharacterized protein n=1 Tax=Cladocopium goreaui TaxID=2562237 RepID=A0A9P1BUS4_9DINO|nr:unnamed protein product [Cladocopium goreaui]